MNTVQAYNTSQQNQFTTPHSADIQTLLCYNRLHIVIGNIYNILVERTLSLNLIPMCQ